MLFQLLAIYAEEEEHGSPPGAHNGGDGTSASSVGTSSPDMFHHGAPGEKGSYRPFHREGGSGGSRGGGGSMKGVDSKHDVIITESDILNGKLGE